ncbi:hypothetical protein HDU96_005207 [Phlyctochytrium bullatum]|nr:hypothetical protein HDU96_005207 [Phlyctochytrium bullatum]
MFASRHYNGPSSKALTLLRLIWTPIAVARGSGGHEVSTSRLLMQMPTPRRTFTGSTATLTFGKRAVLNRSESERASEIQTKIGALPELRGEPKKPLTSFFMFCKDHRAHVLATEEMQEVEGGARLIAVSKKLGEMWKQADEDTKKKYNDAYEDAKNQYQRDHDDWRSSLTEADRKAYDERKDLQSELKKLGTKLTDPTRPKRPMTTYLMFSRDVWKNRFPPELDEEDKRRLVEAQTVTSTAKIISEIWKRLPEEAKRRYQEQYEEERAKFDEELEQYKNSASADALPISNYLTIHAHDTAMRQSRNLMVFPNHASDVDITAALALQNHQEKERTANELREKLRALSKPYGEPKRPHDPFFLFCLEMRPAVQETEEMKSLQNRLGSTVVTRKLKEMWEDADVETKEKYAAIYREAANRYKEDYESWKRQLDPREVAVVEECQRLETEIRMMGIDDTRPRCPPSYFKIFSKDVWDLEPPPEVDESQLQRFKEEKNLAEKARLVGKMWKMLADTTKMMYIKTYKLALARFKEDRYSWILKLLVNGGVVRSKARKTDPNRPKRPPPPYAMFTRDLWAGNFPPEVDEEEVERMKDEKDIKARGMIVGQMWKALPESVKEYRVLNGIRFLRTRVVLVNIEMLDEMPVCYMVSLASFSASLVILEFFLRAQYANDTKVEIPDGWRVLFGCREGPLGVETGGVSCGFEEPDVSLADIDAQY